LQKLAEEAERIQKKSVKQEYVEQQQYGFSDEQLYEI
jgi:hypothetical protein